jgi:hypothetical protein
MSKANDIAESMVAHLTALPALARVPVMVDRQKDIDSMVSSKVNKGAGACVTVLYEGFSNPDASSSNNANVTRRYTASVYSRPVLVQATDMPADDIVEAVARSLHRWDPEETLPGFVEIQVTGCDLRGDFKYLIYDLDISVTSRL